jgi:hypothetical protein
MTHLKVVFRVIFKTLSVGSFFFFFSKMFQFCLVSLFSRKRDVLSEKDLHRIDGSLPEINTKQQYYKKNICILGQKI